MTWTIFFIAQISFFSVHDENLILITVPTRITLYPVCHGNYIGCYIKFLFPVSLTAVKGLDPVLLIHKCNVKTSLQSTNTKNGLWMNIQ